MIINIVMISLFTAALVALAIIFFRTHQSSKAAQPENYEELKTYVRNEIEKASTMMVTNLGLSLEDREKQLRQREDLRNYIRNSCSGDRGARKATLQLVKDKMQEVVNGDNIEHYCSFSPDDALPITMFEAVLYINDTNTRERLKNMPNIFGMADDGFINIFDENYLNTKFSLEFLKKLYESQYLMMDSDDKLEILAQIIFSELYGLGAIDTLNYQTRGIEEIQIGLRGPQTRDFDYRRNLKNENNVELCAKDTTDVICRGCLCNIEFLGFKTDAELQRVIGNLIINCNKGELTEKNPKIVVDTIDRRRVAAARPPVADAWLALIRKFNMADIILTNLYHNKALTDTLTWIVKSGAHIAVTGEMETGKTTLLRSLLALTNPKYAIRIVENDSFELNGRYYFTDRNVTSLRVSKEFPEEDVLAFARKTSGQIFSVGEVNQPAIANLTNNLSKISTQIFFSAHYTSTSNMVSDFKNAKINAGFTNVRLAEIEAVEGLDFDIHIVNKEGHRYIEYINEVILTNDKFIVQRILTGTPDGEVKIEARPSEKVDVKAKRILTTEEYPEYIRFWDEHTKTEEPEWLSGSKKQ